MKRTNKFLMVSFSVYFVLNIFYYIVSYVLSMHTSNPFFVRVGNWQIATIYAPAAFALFIIGSKVIGVRNWSIKAIILTCVAILALAIANFLVVYLVGAMFA